jgi:hypothetical protein
MPIRSFVVAGWPVRRADLRVTITSVDGRRDWRGRQGSAKARHCYAMRSSDAQNQGGAFVEHSRRGGSRKAVKSSCGGSHAFAVGTAKRGACARCARWATRWTPMLEWVWSGCARIKRGCTGEARDAEMGVFSMDGLREPAEALRKKLSPRGLRRADHSDALAVSDDCGRDTRLHKKSDMAQGQIVGRCVRDAKNRAYVSTRLLAWRRDAREFLKAI